MIHRCRRAAQVAAAWVFLLGSEPSEAQTVGTLEIGTSVVEYDGFLVSGAAVLSPALRYDADNLSVGAQSTWVIFESGNEILQGTAAAAWLTEPHNGWRAEFSGSIGAGQYESAPGYGHFLARTRVHYHGESTGAWASGATGQSFAGGSATPLELALGVWTIRNSLAATGTLTRSWIAGDSYVDVGGTARWSSSVIQLDLRAGTRAWSSDNSGTGPYGEISGLISVNNRIAVMLSGGKYASDAVRGLVSAKYINAGIRVNLFGPRVSARPIIARAAVRAEEKFASSEDASAARLDIERSGNSSTLRVRVTGVSAVEIMGDFTDWEPVSLSPTDTGVWEVRLPITPGVYRINLRTDGGPWLVPLGTRMMQTEFGGAVGVVTVGR